MDKDLVLLAVNLGLIPGPSSSFIWFLQLHQELSLSTKLGVFPEYPWVLQKKQTDTHAERQALNTAGQCAIFTWSPAPLGVRSNPSDVLSMTQSKQTNKIPREWILNSNCLPKMDFLGFMGLGSSSNQQLIKL